MNIHYYWKFSLTIIKVTDFILEYLPPPPPNISPFFFLTQRFVQFTIYSHGNEPLHASLPPLLTLINHFYCPEVVTVCSVAPVSEKWLLKKILVSSTVIVWPVHLRGSNLHAEYPK
jgi:hypothetical protein